MRHESQKYCSPRCKDLHNHPLIPPELQKQRGRAKKERPPKPGKTIFIKQCDRCGKQFETVYEDQKHCSKACSAAMRRHRETRRHQEARPVLECAYCGEPFKAKGNNSKYCSSRCERKQHSMMRKLRKKGCPKIEYGITARALMRRDKGICHICHGKVNINDWSRNESGFFIAGNSYPTVDHVMPLAKGGSHTWDNVKLAHLKCNGEKSDREVYESINGQLAFAI